MCRVSMVVAKGLVQRWMPRPKEPITSAREGGGGGGGGKKSGKQGEYLIPHLIGLPNWQNFFL